MSACLRALPERGEPLRSIDSTDMLEVCSKVWRHRYGTLTDIYALYEWQPVVPLSVKLMDMAVAVESLCNDSEMMRVHTAT